MHSIGGLLFIDEIMEASFIHDYHLAKLERPE